MKGGGGGGGGGFPTWPGSLPGWEENTVLGHARFQLNTRLECLAL